MARDLNISFATLRETFATQTTYYAQRVAPDVGYDVYLQVRMATLLHCAVTDPADIAVFDGGMKKFCVEAPSSDDAIALCIIQQQPPDIATAKPTAPKATLYSHDWSDPTTWYEQAVRVVAEAATYNAGGGAPYWQLAHVNVIDAYHGRLTGEDYLKDAGGFSYRVAVTRNGVAMVEQDPHYGAGGDYLVDYANGRVMPVVPGAWDPADVVAVTHHYATGSRFTIKPAAGKRLILDFVEVQFGLDIVLTDSTVFQAFGLVEVFAPQYLQANGGPYPPGTLIPLQAPLIYKTMRDYQNDAVKSYVAYPALGGPGWRGIQQPAYVLDWDYVRATMLSSKAGMEIRVSLQHEVPFGGNYATATFYCSSEDE